MPINWGAGAGVSSVLAPAYGLYEDKVLGYAPIAYWMLGEESGSTAVCQVDTAQNGTYVGVNLGSCLSPDGVNFAPYFDGANDYVDIYTATLQAAYDVDLYSIGIWAKVASPSVWSDAAQRFTLQVGNDGNNRHWIQKSSTNNRLTWNDNAGGTTVSKFEDTAGNAWIFLVLTVDRGGDELKAYRNGIQVGTTAGSLGTFSGNITESKTNIGAYDEAPQVPWHGWLSHCMLFDKILTPAQVLDLSHIEMQSYQHKVAFYLNPFAHWPLNERTGSVARDIQNHQQNGTHTGVALQDALGPDDEPVPFYDGTNDYTNVQTAAFQSNIDGAEGTLAAWSKVNDVGVWTDGTNRVCLRAVDTTDFNEEILLEKDSTNNALNLRYQAGGVTLQRFPVASYPGWFHHAMSWSAADDEVRFYVAGNEPLAPHTGLGVWAGTVDLSFIGAANATPIQAWHGWLSNVSVFNRPVPRAGIKVLSSTDIDYKQLVLAHEPIAYWPLDEASGSTANCEVDANQDGTYTGVTLGQRIGDANGVSFVCPYFDGANDYVDIDTAAIEAVFDGDEGSMMLWLRPATAGQWTDTTQRRPLVLFGNNGTNDQLYFDADGAGTFTFNRRGNGTDRSDALAVSGGNWVQFVGTWSRTDNEVELYMNGVSSGSPGVCDQDWSSATFSRALIGVWAVVSLPWLGWLSHCALFDRALTAAEVARLYDIRY